MRRLAVFLFLLAGCAPEKVPNLRSSDPYEVSLAVLDLSYEAPTPELKERLGGFLDDPRMMVRDAALIVIGDLKFKSFIPRIRDLIDFAGDVDPDEEVRCRACITLGELTDPEQLDEDSVLVLAKVIRLGKEKSIRVRRRACYALAEFGLHYAVLDALVDGVADPDPSVKFVAHRMLTNLTRQPNVPMQPGQWRTVVDAFKTQK